MHQTPMDSDEEADISAGLDLLGLPSDFLVAALSDWDTPVPPDGPDLIVLEDQAALVAMKRCFATTGAAAPRKRPRPPDSQQPSPPPQAGVATALHTKTTPSLPRDADALAFRRVGSTVACLFSLALKMNHSCFNKADVAGCMFYQATVDVVTTRGRGNSEQLP